VSHKNRLEQFVKPKKILAMRAGAVNLQMRLSARAKARATNLILLFRPAKKS
jgi:hypothetical protein